MVELVPLHMLSNKLVALMEYRGTTQKASDWWGTMLKKTNPGEPQQPKRAGRIRMDTLGSTPKLHDVRMVLVEAQRNKGTLCELPLRTPTGAIFLLSCQSDHLSAEPCWTLYEGVDGSAQMWSYMNEDLEMITDIINMSISQKAPSAQVDDAFNEVKSVLKSELDAKSAEQYKPWGQYAQQPEQQPAPQAWPQAEPAAGQWPMQQQQQPQQQQMPAQQWPGADPSQGQWPVTPGGFPGQAAQPAPNQWPGAAPQQQWPNAAPQAPYPELQGQPQQWPAAPQPAQYVDPAQQQSQWPGVGASATPYPELAPQQPQVQQQETSIWKHQNPATTGGAMPMKKFIDFLNSQKNLTIGEVLFAPDLPPSCSDSAMRLQEMVCKNEINDKQAIDALKLAAQKGTGVVDDSVLGEIRMRSQATAGAARATATMLKDSGIITEADLNAAEMKAEREGKDISETLIAMGKTDKLMVDAATQCVEYVSLGKIRPDQAIIALNYCMRARAPIDQAFEELSIDVK